MGLFNKLKDGIENQVENKATDFLNNIQGVFKETVEHAELDMNDPAVKEHPEVYQFFETISGTKFNIKEHDEIGK